jgi:D-alanyl-D-alanine carboxypeptidase
MQKPLEKRSLAIVDGSGNFLINQHEILPVYSITKTFIAASVFAANINLDEPISNWIDKSLVPDADRITVRHLLNHTSGIRDYGALVEYTDAVAAGKPWTDEQFAAHTLQRPLLFSPGENWSYSNPGYWLLSRIVQRNTGLEFTGYLQKFVLGPLELLDTSIATGIFASDLKSYAAEWVWHGLLLSSASDLVKFMRSDFVKPLLDPSDLVRVPINHPDWSDPRSAYGLMVDVGKRFGHNGDGPHYSASCFHFLTTNITACLLTRTSEEGTATEELFHIAAGYE